MTLRAGKVLGQEEVVIRVTGLTINGEADQTVVIKLKLKDFESAEGRAFFGDRPLGDPGYSAFQLSGEVSAGAVVSTQQRALDVWRVEQRLKYLGYSAFGTNMSNGTFNNDTLAIPKEFKVDGAFAEEEESALRAFYGATHYSTYKTTGTSSGSGNYGFQTTATSQDAKKVAPGASTGDPADDTNWEWLNAYNAPHWVNVYSALGIPTNKFGQLSASGNFKDGTSQKMETYATSWVLDLLLAWEKSKPTLVAQQLISANTVIQLNGLADPTYLWGHSSGGHSVGMGIDMGVGPAYISYNNQRLPAVVNSTFTGSTWSLQNAINLSAPSANLPSTRGNNQSGALRNFLSLYAVTQSGTANGTWSNLQPTYANPTALFGSGGQNTTQLIQNVWIGGVSNVNATIPNQNPYSVINEVLGHLGFNANGMHHGTQVNHHNHFHVDLRALTRVPLPQNLLTENVVVDQVALVAVEALSVKVQVLIDHIKADLGLSQGEVTMFIPDMPAVPPQNVPVMIAQANQAQPGDVKTVRTLGVCFPAPNEDYTLENVIEPPGQAQAYLRMYENKDVTGPATITIIQQPKHGVLHLVTEADGDRFGEGTFDPAAGLYAYLPEKGYVGKDRATVLVEIGGIKVKVEYFFQAISGPLGNTGVADRCGKTGDYWKISANLDGGGNSNITNVAGPSQAAGNANPVTDAVALASWLRAAELHGSLANLDTINVSFSSLAGGAVGQTSGNTITLDTTAAGHGWYIDPTPLDNSDDYLPTSNPDVWQAKAGTDAAGKMDLLSVLLHEYGHALGLSHSADSGDYMAATLQPGQRRLPSAEELQLMSELVAQLREGQAPTPSLPQGGREPGVPNPSLPLGGLLLGRLALGRRPEEASASSQALFAAHPTLQGGSLQNLQDWATQGQVSLASGGGATLQEGAASQTRLNQVFTINERDRFLSFTLAGTALDDVHGGPDDAFEVALLEANTGRALTGALGLSHTDALLNLQANGTQTMASSVSSVTNADGSRTYRVDLAGIAAGTAVNLSFDLIGFGRNEAERTSSHITVRDVRVSGLPELHDDVASLLEDGALAFDPFAQVDNAALLALGSQVVDAPAHGTVLTHADGTFSYTPDAKRS